MHNSSFYKVWFNILESKPVLRKKYRLRLQLFQGLIRRRTIKKYMFFFSRWKSYFFSRKFLLRIYIMHNLEKKKIKKLIVIDFGPIDAAYSTRLCQKSTFLCGTPNGELSIYKKKTLSLLFLDQKFEKIQGN